MVLLLPSLSPAAAPPLPGAPFIWIYDVHDLRSLPRAKAIGANTIFLDLPEEIDAGALQDAREVVRAAGEEDLHVVIGLPTTLAKGYRAALDNPPYVDAVTAYVRDVVSQFRDEPAVIGWATGDYLEKDLSLSDEAFRAFLLRKYRTTDGLNDAWHAKLGTVETVTQKSAIALDTALPFAAGMPSVDVADFQAGQYRDMMVFWARLVREASGGRGLLFTGRVTLYRSLPLIPDEYDVIVTSMPPELLERDWATHNVQSLDLARRGGRRNVMPCLRIPTPPDTENLDADRTDLRDQLFASNRIHEWMMEAAMHGACGLSFEAEPDILAQPQIQAQLQKGLAWMAGQPAWHSRPRGAAAILYEPYADGFSALNVPVYGYVKDLSDREPSDLVNSLKGGTRYGPADYLALADLPAADLDRYSVVFAPLALDLPEPAQEKLAAYVLKGGVLVADIGAGFAQTGSWQVLPPRLAGLFGVASVVEMKSVAGNLTIHQPSPALPDLPGGASTTGDFQATSGSSVGGGPYAVHGWAGFALIDPTAIPFARLDMGLNRDKKPTFAGVISRNVGPGVSFFATHRLWAGWLPGNRLFNEFHGELWQRRATIELLGGPFVAPGLELAESDEGSVVLYNPGDLYRLRIALYAGGHRLYSGAVCQFSAALTDETGLRTGGVLATLDAPRHASAELVPVPVEIRPLAGICTAQLTDYGKDAIRFTIAGERSAPEGRPGALAPSRGWPKPVRLTVRSGAYRITPGSRHLLRATRRNGDTDERELTADSECRLVIDLEVDHTEIELQPVG